jgi:hypothetical protein
MEIIHDWAGEHLGEGPLALFLHPALPSTPLILGTACAPNCGAVIRRERLGAFLQAHAEYCLVCHDAAETHWALVDHCRAVADGAAESILWSFSRDYRLHDLALLDQLVYLAVEGAVAPALGLEALAGDLRTGAIADVRRHLSTLSVDRPLADPSPIGGDLLAIASILLRAYQDLRSQADCLIAELRLRTPLPTAFGPLALGLEVQAGIALAAAGRYGLHLDEGDRRSAVKACQRIRDDAIARLRQDREIKGIFTTERGQVRLDGRGYPEIHEGPKDVWLKRLLGAVPVVHGLPILVLTGKKGRVIGPRRWHPVARCHPLLADWARLYDACDLQNVLAGAPRRGVRPRYEVFPRLRSSAPDLDAVQRLGLPPVFLPAQGSFLVIAFAGLALRALAAVLERDDPGSRFAALCRREDPSWEVARFLSGLDEAGFVALAASDRKAADRWRRLARALLHYVPLGVSEEGFCDTVSRDSDDPLALPEVREHYRRLKERFPDIGGYVRDDTLARIAANLGVPVEHLAGRLRGWANRHESPDALTLALLGQEPYCADLHRILDVLRSCGCERLEPVLQAASEGRPCEEFYLTLTGRPFVSRTGRVYGRMTPGEALGLTHLDLADAVRKHVLYEIVAAGHPLAGIAGDEFALQVSDREEVEPIRTEVVRLARSTAEEILSGMPVDCLASQQEKWPGSTSLPA